MAIEAEHAIAKAGKVLPEDCVAPKLRHRREHRQEAIREYLASEVDDHPEVAHHARGVEGRAELVLEEWCETARVDRDLREDVLHRDIDGGLGRCPNAVHRAAAGRARAREVEYDVAALDRHLELDRQRVVHNAVAIDVAGKAVDPVWDALDAGPHLALGAGF